MNENEKQRVWAILVKDELANPVIKSVVGVASTMTEAIDQCKREEHDILNYSIEILYSDKLILGAVFRVNHRSYLIRPFYVDAPLNYSSVTQSEDY